MMVETLDDEGEEKDPGCLGHVLLLQREMTCSLGGSHKS